MSLVVSLVTWVKKNWKTITLVVAFPIGLLVLLSKLLRPRVTVVSSELSEHEELASELHQKTEEKKKKLQAKHTQETLAAQTDYDRTIAKNQADILARSKELRNDPIQLNDYLKRVGKNVRQTKN